MEPDKNADLPQIGYEDNLGNFSPWVNAGVALLLGALAFIGYLMVLSPGAFPGEPASLVAGAVGVKPVLTAQHVVWRGLVGWIADWSRGGIMLRVNLFSAVCGALSVGLMYLLTTSLLGLALDDEQLGNIPTSQRHLARRIARTAAIFGGIIAALTLAFSIPFWIASTQAYYHAFYVAWLLFTGLCIARFAESDHLGWAVAAAFLHGAGMTQTSAFVAFAPIIGLAMLYLLWYNRRIYPAALLAIAGAALLGMSLIFVSAQVFYKSDGFWLMNYGGFFQIIRHLWIMLVGGIRASLPQVGWLILLGLTIVPWIAALITAARALNGERDWGYGVLNLAIAIVTVAVLINIKASPWRIFGVGNTTIVPYMLTAMTTGYLACYAYLLPTHFWGIADENGKNHHTPLLTRRVIIALIVLFCCGTTIANYGKSNHRGTRFIALYADRLLDNLEGRTWLATNGAMDDVLLLRAHERGIDLNCLNLSQGNSQTAIRIASSKLPHVRLRNSATLGFVTLLQEWISSDLDAGSTLALALVPDLWSLGDYEMLPRGFVFLGISRDELEQVSWAKEIEHHNLLWGELEEAFAEIPESAPDWIHNCRDRIVRPHASFIGNNLGYTLELLDKPDQAFAVYDRVHQFDPDNVSALLNWSTMVFNGRAPEKKDDVFAALEGLNKRLEGTQLPIWSLSRVFGYVSRPEQFAQLGWSWAGSGQPRLALKALEKAEEGTPAENRIALQSSMARIHLLQDRPEETERVYYDMLIEDAGNRGALMGLVRIQAMRGDTASARTFLERAEKAGVPRATLMIATALIARVEGNVSQARSILQEQVDLDPTNIEAWSHLCALLTDEKDMPALEVAVKRLEDAAGTDAFPTLIARTGQAMAENNPRVARDFLSRAQRLQPHAIALLEQLLLLDYQLVDKNLATEHARMLLRLNSANGTANYIMGSLAAERRDYDSAEDYLRRSVEAGETVQNLNDLAFVLLRRDQVAEAEKRVLQALKLDDQDYSAWDTFGMIRVARGEYEEAEVAFNTSLKLFSEDLRVHVHLAEALLLKKETSRAAEILRGVIKEVDTLPREDWEKFEELHLKILGTKYSRRDK